MRCVKESIESVGGSIEGRGKAIGEQLVTYWKSIDKVLSKCWKIYPFNHKAQVYVSCERSQLRNLQVRLGESKIYFSLVEHPFLEYFCEQIFGKIS